MAISRSARITIRLVIDVFFFFVELIVGQFLPILYPATIVLLSTGYAVGSLALVADSFHMLKSVHPHNIPSWSIDFTSTAMS
jgi:solute carrier family 30 (zinc transporter), member 1